MRLTTQTDYALRMLMFLAINEGNQTIDDIATAYGISKNHLMKVAQRLAAAGLIDSQRGRGGGLSLSSAPEDINVGHVVRLMEETSKFVECQTGAANSCVITPACGLVHILSDALELFLSHLDRFALSDIIKNRKGLEKIFSFSG
ncbi:MAG: Rrf2 family transcriptional regulator [Parasphingorhabdus sp.]|uniref:RrF2 family transcriptional regulator n=1 Tax=Parasphingorhabdus sp. TaxID=2709688 RepID=UPI00300397F2